MLVQSHYQLFRKQMAHRKRRRILSSVTSVSSDLNPAQDPVAKVQLAAWGCNSTRQAGNITEVEVRLPRQVVYCIH